MNTIWFDGECKFSDIDSLPNVHALYFVMKEKEVLYIGKTFALGTRFQTHKSEKWFSINEATSVKWKIYTSLQAEQLSKAEEDCISKFNPVLNKLKGGGCTKRYNSSYKRRYHYENRSEFHEQVYSLLWDHIEHSLSKTHSICEIAKCTNIPRSWITDLSVGVNNPDINNLKVLYFYLSNTKLPIPSELLITQPTGQRRTDKLYAKITKEEHKHFREEYKYNSCKARFSELCAQLEKELNAKTEELNKLIKETSTEI